MTRSQLIASLTSSLVRTNPSCSSSSSSTTSSSSSNNNHHQLEIINKNLTQVTSKNKYIFLLNAFVNGFAQLKLSAEKIDYEYIIEIYWSNETKSYVKRTYEDFVTFHRHLIQVFSQFFNEIKSNVNSIKGCRNSMSKMGNEEYLMPILPAAKKPFWVSQLKLAESREIELNNYVQRLLKLPTKVNIFSKSFNYFQKKMQ